MAKRVVKLINGAAKTINTDERIGDAHAGIEEEFKDAGPWTRKLIVNCACMGEFFEGWAGAVLGEYLDRQAAPEKL